MKKLLSLIIALAMLTGMVIPSAVFADDIDAPAEDVGEVPGDGETPSILDIPGMEEFLEMMPKDIAAYTPMLHLFRDEAMEDELIEASEIEKGTRYYYTVELDPGYVLTDFSVPTKEIDESSFVAAFDGMLALLTIDGSVVCPGDFAARGQEDEEPGDVTGDPDDLPDPENGAEADPEDGTPVDPGEEPEDIGYDPELDPGFIEEEYEPEITLLDVAWMMRFIAGWMPTGNIMIFQENGDFNLDGTFNLRDVALLMRYISGWETVMNERLAGGVQSGFAITSVAGAPSMTIPGTKDVGEEKYVIGTEEDFIDRIRAELAEFPEDKIDAVKDFFEIAFPEDMEIFDPGMPIDPESPDEPGTPVIPEEPELPGDPDEPELPGDPDEGGDPEEYDFFTLYLIYMEYIFSSMDEPTYVSLEGWPVDDGDSRIVYFPVSATNDIENETTVFGLRKVILSDTVQKYYSFRLFEEDQVFFDPADLAELTTTVPVFSLYSGCFFDNYRTEIVETVDMNDDNFISVPEEPVELTFEESLSDFAFRLFNESFFSRFDPSDDVIVSPISIQIAVAMAAAGAKGETLEYLEKVLGTDDFADFGEKLGNYIASLPTDVFGEGIKEKLHIANSVWLRKSDSIRINEDFVEILQKTFAAIISEEDFNDPATVDKINSWISENTDGMIEKMINAVSPETAAYIINAISFDCTWADPFNNINEEDFTAFDGSVRKVEMMNSVEDYYLENDFATGFIKPFSGGKFAFVGLLPNEIELENDYPVEEDYPIEEDEIIPDEDEITVGDEYVYLMNLVGSLDQNSFADLLAGKQEADVHVRIPKFKYDFDLSVVDDLIGGREFGVPIAFDPARADFSGMAESDEGDFYISDIMHKAAIDLNEKGVRAAAVTVVEMMNASIALEEKEQKYVTLDRPFLYAIIDTETNVPMFIGAVGNLGEAEAE